MEYAPFPHPEGRSDSVIYESALDSASSYKYEPGAAADRDTLLIYKQGPSCKALNPTSYAVIWDTDTRQGNFPPTSLPSQDT